MLLNLWAWVLVHPEAIATAALAVLSVIAATIANARAKGAPVSWFERFVDRVSVRTRANAANAGWSWPIVGRSIFEAALDASAPPPKDPPSPPSEPGYIDRAVLWIVGGVALLALGASLLSGCPMPAPDGCSPGARRCHEDTPQVCSPGQRWTPADVTCSTVNASCVVRDGVPACLRGEQ